MTKRAPVAVFFLSILTIGIYAMVWYAKTGKEMNAKGARVPPFIVNFLPPFSIIWIWEYSKGIELISNGETTAVRAMLMQMSLGIFSLSMLQSKFNKVIA